MDFVVTIKQALAGDQDSYTQLYKAVLPLAKSMLYRCFQGLWKDTPELSYEAVHHLLVNLDKCPRPVYFIPWTKKVIRNFYLQELRDRSTMKYSLLTRAASIDKDCIDEDGDAYWLQIADPKNHVKQLEANIDATFVLSRVRDRFRKAVVQRGLYGYDDMDKRNGMDVGSNQTVHELRREVARGEYPQLPSDESFALPAMVV